MAGCRTLKPEVREDTARGTILIADGEELPADCPICMGVLLESNAEGHPVPSAGLCRAPCKHVFHTSCLQEWASRASTCPLCRSDLRGETPLDGGGDVELQHLLAQL